MFILHFRIVIIALLALFLLIPLGLQDVEESAINQSASDLVIGNSHAKAINFSAMGLVGYNGYENGADVRQTINRYYELEKSLPSLVRVWIPIAPVYLFRDKTYPNWARYEKTASKFADKLSIANENFPHTWSKISNFWSYGKRQIHLLKSSFLKKEPNQEMKLIVEGAPASRKILKVEEVDQLAEKTALNHVKNSSLQNTANFKRLEQFSEYLRQKNITLIFFTPPYTSEYYNHPLLAEFESSYKTRLTQIVQKHSNTHYFDFHDLYQRESYIYFDDDDHLNLSGAKAFSSILQKSVSDKLDLY
jgi:hypothetical protein